LLFSLGLLSLLFSGSLLDCLDWLTMLVMLLALLLEGHISSSIVVNLMVLKSLHVSSGGLFEWEFDGGLRVSVSLSVIISILAVLSGLLDVVFIGLFLILLLRLLARLLGLLRSLSLGHNLFGSDVFFLEAKEVGNI